MASSRRERIREELGIAEEENADALAIRQEEERREKQAAKQAALENDDDYKLVKGISTTLDDYFLDPIIGFVLPGFGDILSSVMTLPYYYVALFKIKSIPLALAIAYNMMIDMLIGAVPFVGDLIDVFHKSYKKSYRLIVGFVEDDAEIIKTVKERAFKCFVMIVILGYAVYWVITKTIFITQSAWHWISGLFS